MDLCNTNITSENNSGSTINFFKILAEKRNKVYKIEVKNLESNLVYQKIIITHFYKITVSHKISHKKETIKMKKKTKKRINNPKN